MSWAGAIFAAIAYGVASVMQASAARDERRSSHLDALLLVRLLALLPYVAGLALDLIGFLASVVALRNLPLFVVQPAIASSVGVTALVASKVFGTTLRRADHLALAGLLVGMALLAAAARSDRAVQLSTGGERILLAGVVMLLAVGVVGARLRDHASAVVLAVGAGLSWAGTGIAARVLVVPSPIWRLVTEPAAWALAAYGVLGTLLFATALQRGSVTAAAALVFVVETIVPALIGIGVLGDHTRPHFQAVAVLGLIATIVSTISLARHAQVTPDDRSTEPPASGSSDPGRQLRGRRIV